MVVPKSFYDGLVAVGVEYFAGVPDSLTTPLKKKFSS